jgi:rhodanese-related sulfurtransferase
LQLIDVRSRAEWLQGNVPRAISVPLLELSAQSASIDRSKRILIYCQENYRATIAASLLLRDQASDIGILSANIGEHPDS